MWGCFSSPPLHQHNHVIKYLSSILHNISIFTKSLAYKPPFLHVSIQPIQVTKTDLYIAINPNQCSLPFNYKVISLLHTLTRISIYPTQTCHTCMHQPDWCIYTHTYTYAYQASSSILPSSFQNAYKGVHMLQVGTYAWSSNIYFFFQYLYVLFPPHLSRH